MNNNAVTPLRRPNVGTTALRLALVFAAYSLVALVLFRPWLAQFSTALLGAPENNLQDFWNVWHAAHDRLADFFHSNALRFPDGTGLLFHSFSYPHVAVVGALARLFGADRAGLIWLNNAGLFASLPLAGTAAYFLVRKFVPHDGAAFVGGFIFAFNPWHVAQLMHHAHVAHIEAVPLFVLAYLSALDRHSRRWLALAIVAGAFAALSCWYFFFYAVYFMAFHAAWRHWHARQPLTGWALQAPLAATAGMLLVLSPLIVPMLLHSGSVEHPGGSDAFVADIEAFFSFPPSHALAGWSASFWARAHRWTSNNTWEGAAYLGLVNLALLAWLWRRHRGDARLRYCFWAIGVFAVLAMGDCLHAFGFDTLLPLPGIVPNHLPFFSQVRTPSRALLIAYLFLGVAIAYALVRLGEAWRGKAWAKPALAAIVLLIGFDYWPAHLEFTDARCPAGLALIAADPTPGFGVLNLPFHGEDDMAMFQQTCHGKPVVQAAISRGFKPPLSDSLDKQNLAVERNQLRQAHVRYLVLDERIVWQEDPNPAKYALRRWLTKTFPVLAKIKAIAVPPYRPAIDKDAYRKAFAVVYRSPDLTILRVD